MIAQVRIVMVTRAGSLCFLKIRKEIMTVIYNKKHGPDIPVAVSDAGPGQKRQKRICQGVILLKENDVQQEIEKNGQIKMQQKRKEALFEHTFYIWVAFLPYGTHNSVAGEEKERHHHQLSHIGMHGCPLHVYFRIYFNVADGVAEKDEKDKNSVDRRCGFLRKVFRVELSGWHEFRFRYDNK